MRATINVLCMGVSGVSEVLGRLRKRHLSELAERYALEVRDGRGPRDTSAAKVCRAHARRSVVAALAPTLRQRMAQSGARICDRVRGSDPLSAAARRVGATRAVPLGSAAHRANVPREGSGVDQTISTPSRRFPHRDETPSLAPPSDATAVLGQGSAFRAPRRGGRAVFTGSFPEISTSSSALCPSRTRARGTATRSHRCGARDRDGGSAAATSAMWSRAWRATPCVIKVSSEASATLASRWRDRLGGPTGRLDSRLLAVGRQGATFGRGGRIAREHRHQPRRARRLEGDGREDSTDART